MGKTCHNPDPIRVFLAEDEPVILEDLCRKVEETDEIFEVVGMAYNGEKAFEEIRRIKPDLLFTDIRMPVCDGIELIKKVRRVIPELRIVIISGYDDFSYAQRAIELGVSNYLLKPVANADFIELMENLKSRILTGRVVRQKEILQKTFTHGMVGDLPNHFRAGVFAVCLLCLGNLCEQIAAAPYEGEYQQQWKKISWTELLSQPPDLVHGWWLVDESVANQKFLILSLDKAQSCGGTFFKKLYTNLHRQLDGFHVHMCFFSKTVPYSELAQVADRLRLAMRMYVRLDTSTCFDETVDKELETDMLPVAILNKLSSCTAVEEAVRLSQCTLEVWKTGDKPQVQIQKGLELILSTLSRSGLLLFNSADLFELRQRFVSVLSTPSISDAGTRFAYLADCLAEGIRRNHATVKDTIRFADEIERYICTHYAECISLSTIAACYGCSQAYISKIFKKAKKELPSRYITRVRMEKAIALLKENPGMDFRVIGEAVGYWDPHYFSRSFKQHTGCTLTEYRNRLLTAAIAVNQ